MADPAFALHLGNGVYLDSDGNIISGPEAGEVVYQAEFTLPVDPKKVAEALKGVKEAFAHADDPDENPEVLGKILEIYGFLFGEGQDDKVHPEKLLAMLATISKIAGTVAPVLMAVGFAIDVAKMFGLFKEGPSALEQLMVKRFDELKTQVASIGDLIHNQGLQSGRQAVILLNNSVINHLNNLVSSNLSLAQLEADLVKITLAHESHVEGLFKLISKSTYETIFDASKYSQVWGLLQYQLFTYPKGPDAPQRATMPPNARPVFDHRLMVPLAAFAAESFLATSRGVAPEYRSTGEFREHLRSFAKSIGELADAMRGQVLARTVYTAAHFTVPLYASEVIRIPAASPFAPDALVMSPTCSRFPVGAMDLRYHDDAFFSAFMTQLIRAEYFGWDRSTRKGGMDFRWLPPATLEFAGNHIAGDDRYRITNPEACAAAANAQSERDYADLLAVSGYAQLLQLSILYRNEATFPNRSQTVQIQAPLLRREPQPAVSVTIESDLRVLTEKLTASARREPQKCRAAVTIWTQPTQRARPIEYKVRLRTLKSIWGTDRWREPVYSAFQYLHYEPEAADPRFMELQIDQRDRALDETLLLELNGRRDAPAHREGHASLAVHSFDWWIPVKLPFSLEVPFEKTQHALRGLGHTSAQLETRPPALATRSGRMPDPRARFAKSGDAVYEASLPALSWLSGEPDWEGQHRAAQASTAGLKWTLDWAGDRIHIELEGEPVDRNYVVYVVVEEQLRGAANAPVLHTAMPVAMNGQLTYVPQAFFDAERQAMQDAARALAEFNRRYRISTEVGPTDPVVGWLRPGDLASVEGLTRALSLAQLHQPALLREVLDVRHGQPGNITTIC